MYLRMGVAVKENMPAWLPVISDPDPGHTLALDRPHEGHIAPALCPMGPVPFTEQLWG